jgi:hypothetical protein
MTRLVRRLFALITVTSLLLSAALCVLWARSHWIQDTVQWRSPSTALVISSTRGDVTVWLNRSDWSGSDPSMFGLKYSGESPPTPAVVALIGMHTLNVNPGDTWVDWHRGGFARMRWQGRGGGACFDTAIVPIWSLAALAAMPSLVWALLRVRAALRRRRRQRAGLCPGCGYDLRASLGRCPECGADAAELSRGRILASS